VLDALPNNGAWKVIYRYNGKGMAGVIECKGGGRERKGGKERTINLVR
jgi:hypothetical protein